MIGMAIEGLEYDGQQEGDLGIPRPKVVGSRDIYPGHCRGSACSC